MRLITLEFHVDDQDFDSVLSDMDQIREYWASQAVRFSLFRDTSHSTRYVGTFFTERSVDEISALIHTDPKAKALFDRLKEADVHIALSVLEEME